MADRSTVIRRAVGVLGIVVAAGAVAGCNVYDYGDMRRVHDLYPNYVDPPSRTILDYAPAATPDVVE